MTLGIAVIVSQVSQPVLASNQAVEQSTADDQETDETQYSVGADIAITSAAGLNINQEFYQIREIFLDEVADPHVIHVGQNLTETDHFKTLFRKVISANAP